MSVEPSPEPESECDPEIATMRLDDGGLIIFDPSKEDAWLQSDSPMEPPE